MTIPFILLAALIAFGPGCSTPSPRHSTPLTEAQVEALYKAQRRPQVFGMTDYSGKGEASFAGAHRLHANHLTTAITKGADRKLPLIEIMSGSPGKVLALLDTSSADSWCTPEAAVVLGLAPLGPPGYTRKPRHVVDDTKGYLCAASTIRIEDLYMENVLLFLRGATFPLGGVARDVTDPAPSVVLGSSFIRAFNYVRFDFTKGEILFSSTTDFRIREEALLASAPMRWVDGALAVEGMIDGTPTNIVLDIAGRYAAGLPGETGTTLRQFSTGDLVSRKVTATPLRNLGLTDTPSPRVGLDMLSRCTLTLDFHRNLVHFERPENAPVVNTSAESSTTAPTIVDLDASAEP